MTEHIRAEIRCDCCGKYKEVEYDLDVGINTLEWKCSRCGTVKTMVRKVEKTEKKNERNFPIRGA